MTGANIDKCQIWQASKIPKNYCHYWIHHPHFVSSTKFHQNWSIFALRPKLPKLWPNRWQVHRLTSVNIDRRQKLEKKYCHHWIHCPRFVQSTKFLQNWRISHSSSKAMASKMTVSTLASVKNHKKVLSLVNSAPSNCSLCKISSKMSNLISCSLLPIPHSPF